MIHDAVGHAHVQKLASHPHRHGPVIARLSPNQGGIEITSALFDARTKVIQIQGTVLGAAPRPSLYDPPYLYTGPTSVIMSVGVSQPISRRRSVWGYGRSENLNSPVGQQVRFTVRLVADTGHFVGGTAVVNLDAFFQATESGRYVDYPSPSAGVVVRLSPHHPHAR